MKTTDKVTERLFQVLSNEEKAYLELSTQQIQEDYKKHFVRIFSTLNRRLSFHTRESLISIPAEDTGKLLIVNWSVLKLARVWLLGQISDDEANYQQFINRLFEFADMHELEALYAALPLLDHPESWIERCKEGIRNNIGTVQEAVIEHNMFPFLYLDEESWNQLVLKAFFTGKKILNIYGLFERNNESLADSIVDYIYERHSAMREIHPMLWILAKEHLPSRALDILMESYEQEVDETKKSILLQSLASNREQLSDSFKSAHAQALEQISPIEEVLEAYK
ncbi:EboA domain-containing protein [Sphingobacterium sp. BN32]|uniref:EboA domain-containing protein n=1 Tax=Sphingobacterium sp. BN32 TaxID=3058432 RepID=UPI00265CABF1|nr:EboA domain-containing protein [Sphingobacterium sp. BN32]WKK57890.1 EboA domain-containing protein [Sphingobacterium sp. BN32]